jgi:hypothetical protein
MSTCDTVIITEIGKPGICQMVPQLWYKCRYNNSIQKILGYPRLCVCLQYLYLLEDEFITDTIAGYLQFRFIYDYLESTCGVSGYAVSLMIVYV